jgi:hypothetical protein
VRVIPPGVLFVGGAALFVPGAVGARATGGYSLVALIPFGVAFAYTGVQWLLDRGGAWQRFNAWLDERSRGERLALGLMGKQPASSTWRVLMGQGALVFGLACIALGAAGVVGAFR